MTSTATPQQKTASSSTWELVHAEPGALVFAVPGLKPTHPLVGRAAGRAGMWVPGGTPAGHSEPIKHPALHYAEYIGRVGMLAAALGVGAALAGQQPGIAWAEPTDADTGATTSSSSAEPGTNSQTSPSSEPTSAPTSTVSSSGGAQTSDSATDTSTSSPSQTSTTVSAPGSTSPEVTISSSGGAQTSTESTGADTSTSPETTSPQTVPTEPAPLSPVEQTPSTAPVQAAPETAPPVQTVETPSATTPAATESGSRHATTPQAAPTVTTPNTTSTPAAVQTPPAATNGVVATNGQTFTTTTESTHPNTTAPTAPVAPAPVGLISRFVNTVLFPFSPATTTPAAAQAAQAPVLWGLFAWIRRTYFNTTPTVAYNPTTTTQVDDTITGHLTGTDTDGDPLTYTTTTPTHGGTVTIAPDGTFTYTVPANMYDTGGTDTFTVTATDANITTHYHGWSGILNRITGGLLGTPGHTATTTVTLNIAAVNAAPTPATPAYTLGTIDHTTGSIPGQLNVTDPDLDTLTYTVAGGPADGHLTLNSTTGTFTYTPTPTARHDAAAENATPTDLYDNFAVSVDDGHGGIINVPVSVAIDPNNTPPTMTLVVSDPNAEGAVNVSVTVTDPDTDPVTYIVVHDPAFGTLAPIAGGYTYTPSAEARHAAAATSGIDTDTFTLRASDLHHGVDEETATITVSPANIAPSGLTQSVNTPNATTGVVTGTITGADADADPLTFTGTATTPKGTVIVDTDGTFAYTPTPEARHHAAADTATPGDKQDTFTVTADDAHGGTASLAVTVAISATNTAPTGDATASPPNPATGVVTGTVTGTDLDGDTLTYGGPGTTPKGAVAVNSNGTFTYTPTPEARHDAAADGATPDQKSDTFDLTINDGHGGTTGVPVTVTIGSANAAPTGIPNVGTPEGPAAVVPGSVIGIDADGDPLTYSGSTTTAKGSVTVNADGTFAYTPTPEARHAAAADTAAPADKQDTFGVTITDGHGGATTVPVTVSIGTSNAAPSGTASVDLPDMTTGVVIGTATGSDTDGDMLTYSGTATTAKGSVVVNTNGTFGYTPNAAARHAASADGASQADKQDNFNVTIDDGHGGLTTVPVTVTISPTNIASSGTANPGTPDPATGVVTGTVTGSDLDGDQMTYSGSTTTPKGSVVVNTDGSFTYTPTNDARHNAADENASAADTLDTFNVTVNDGHGGTSTVDVTVTIGATNAAPTLQTGVSDPNPDTGVVNGSTTGTDPDGDTLVYTGTATTPKGSVIVNPGGTFTYTPSQEARHAAAAVRATAPDKQDSFQVTVDDGHGFTSVITVFVAVDPDNTAPSGTANPGTPDPAGVVTGTITGTDPEGDPLSYAGTATTPKGNVVVTSDGEFTYTPTPEAQHAASADDAQPEDKQDTFDITIDDAHSGVTTVPVTVTIRPANADPTVHLSVPDPDPATGVVAGSVTGTDPDGDTVTASLSGASVKGSVTVDPDGTFTYTPTDEARHVAASDTATPADKLDTFLVTLSDGHGFTTAVLIAVAVAPINTAPAGAYTSGDPDPLTGAVTGTITGTDADGDSLSYTGTATTPKGSVVVNPNGTFDYTPTAEARHAAAADNAGDAENQDTFDITVNDGHGGTTPVSVTVAIGAANIDPAINVFAPQPDPSTGVVNGSVTGIDPDGDTVAPTVTGTTTTPKGSVTINTDGTFTYTPTDAARHNAAADGATEADKQDTFEITVTDGHGYSAPVNVIVVVSPTNAAPTGTAGPLGTDNATGIVTGRIIAADTDADELTYTLTGFAANGAVTFNPDGTFSYDPTDAARLRAGHTQATETDSFTIAISDGHSGTTDVTVSGVPVTPAQLAVGDTIPVGQTPFNVAVSPDGTRAYVANNNSHSVSVMDTDPNSPTFNTVIDTIDLRLSGGQYPFGVAVSSDGTRTYVVSRGLPGANSLMSVIDTSTDTVIDTIPLGTSYNTDPQGVAVNPDGTRAYVANRQGNSVLVIDIDAASGTYKNVIATVPVGSYPFDVAVNPAGTRAYVTNAAYPGTVSVIDTATNSLIETIPVGSVPYGVAVSPDGTRAYVANRLDNSVSVIDTETNRVIDTVPVGSYPDGAAVSPDSSVAYVVNQVSNSMSVIDTETNRVIDTVPVGSGPFWVAVSPDGSRMYVTNVNSGDSAVSVISLVSGQNRAPVAADPAYTITGTNPVSGTVTGSLNVTDPDHDTVSFTTPATTAKGSSVTVTPTGVFTYTPTAQARHAASAETATPADKQETFEAKVIDAHGASVTVPVTVAITPMNAVPVSSGPTVSNPNAAGVVAGSLNVTDMDADSLTYHVSTAPTFGRIAIDPATGGYTYTPYADARLNAYITPAQETDTFTVTVTDGHGSATGVTVAAVPVSPADAVLTGNVTTNSGPYGVAVSPNGARAYVVNQINGSVSVVDTATNTVTTAIPVSGGPVGIALTPNGKYAYVTRSNGTVAVVDTATNSVTATITVGSNPRGVAISPNGTLAYVTHNSGTVTVINTADNTVATTINVDPLGGSGGDPFGVAFSPDGARAYVTRAEKSDVAVIDTASNTVIASIPVASWPHGVAVSPDGTRAYVANTDGHSVSVIDTATNTVVATVPIAGRPTQVAVSPDGTIVYVTPLDGSNLVSLIDTKTNTVVDTVAFPAGAQLQGVAASPDGIHAYVTNWITGRMSTITLDAAPLATTTVGSVDPATGQVAVTLSAGDPAGEPVGVTNTAPSQGSVVVVNNSDGTWSYTYTPTEAARVRAGTTPGVDTDTFTVTVTDAYGIRTAVPVSVPISPAEARVTATVSVGNQPREVAVSPDGTRAYVTNGGMGTVSVINTATNAVIATIPVSGGVTGVAVSPDGTLAYVTNSGGYSVAVIDTNTNAVIRYISDGSYPGAVAVRPGGTEIYFTHGGTSVGVANSSTMLASIYMTGAYPVDVAFSPDGTLAYVANVSGDSVLVINTSTRSVTATIPVGDAPVGVVFSPDGTRAYVVNNASMTVSVINTATNAVIATAPLGSGGNANGITVSPDGSLLYVTRGVSVSVVDTVTNTVIATVPVGNQAMGVAFRPDGTAYVVNTASNTVSVISLVPTV